MLGWRRTYSLYLVAAFVFGAADQYLGSRVELGPWAATVSLMSAPWVALPFVFGCRTQTAAAGAVVGLATTMAALLGYFVMTLSPVEGVSLSHVDLPSYVATQRLNLIGGVVTGPLFGWLGWCWRERRASVGAVLVAGALALEPLAESAAGRLGPTIMPWVLESAAGILLAAWFVRRRYEDAGDRASF